MSLEILPEPSKAETAVATVATTAKSALTIANSAGETASYVYNATSPVVHFLVFQTPALAIIVSIVIITYLIITVIERSALEEARRIREHNAVAAASAGLAPAGAHPDTKKDR